MRWAINEAPMQLEVTRGKKHTGCHKHALRWNSMNIYEGNSARNFRVQSECEWTLERNNQTDRQVDRNLLNTYMTNLTQRLVQWL